MGGDDDEGRVVTSWSAEDGLDRAAEHEGVENYITEKVRAEKVVPGKYYPPTDEMVREWRQVKGERGQ